MIASWLGYRSRQAPGPLNGPGPLAEPARVFPFRGAATGPKRPDGEVQRAQTTRLHAESISSYNVQFRE